MTTEELLNKLKENATPRVKSSLDAVYQVCNEIKNVGGNDFSISTISKLGGKYGVPKAQSIRNNSGEVYRTLIKSFLEISKPKCQLQQSSKYSWIDEIASTKHKTLVKMIVAELMEKERMIKEIIPPGQQIKVFDGIPISPDIKLSDLEFKALTYLNSDEFLKKWSFKRGQYGDALDSNDVRVLPIATFDAIDKALKSLI
ncbi:MAG TPA: gamma-mobile-trio protein GmtX [Cellvibrio sp.]|nr:gamma-mobile-trio protein GmtX [Cellvibrio sp.]